MAHLDDLISQVKDDRLRRDMEQALATLKRKQKFGLVYEEHLPEHTALFGLPIRPGDLVQRRDDPKGKARYTVLSVDGDTVTAEPEDGDDSATMDAGDLLTLKRFGEPIYPALTPLGHLDNGPADKPHHAVINAENYHALQALLYVYEGQVDCIYLDPPYNTGARDWKYNNDYVDGNDVWRHSKWLSMMERRLRLAKRLLKRDGVLIVTIDEHEVHNLGVMLGQIFPGVARQMVTIVINPKGVTNQGRFSRVEEYAYFVFMPEASVMGRGDDLLTPGADEEVEEGTVQRPRWKGLLRSGTNASRKDRKNMFYPVLVDEEHGAVVGTGDPLPFDELPDFDTKIDGYKPAWPVRKGGRLGNWGVGHTTLRKLIEKGYVSLGRFDPKRNTWGLSYLSQQPQEQIASGVLQVLSYDKTRNVVDVAYTDVAARRLKTVWHRSKHDAGVGGSDVLRAIFQDRRFDFPKSVYAVQDSLAAALRDKPDALILDVFAGSGTTFHAASYLNEEDGGQRRCVLVTNNEVKEEDEKRLRKNGHAKGDSEFEALGIFEHVTRPRVEAVVTGKRPDGNPIPGTDINSRPFAAGFPENVAFYRLDYLDPDDVSLGRQFDAILPMLWLAAGGVGEPEFGAADGDFSIPKGSTYAVLFREDRYRAFAAALAERTDLTHVWIVTDSQAAYAEIRSSLPRDLRVGMLYRDYLRNFRINTR